MMTFFSCYLYQNALSYDGISFNWTYFFECLIKNCKSVIKNKIMFVFGKQQGCMYLRYYTSEIRIVTTSIFAFIKPSNEQFNKLNTFTGRYRQYWGPTLYDICGWSDCPCTLLKRTNSATLL